MSQLQVNRINDASGGVLAPISSVMRNRIINGGMTISQRNGTSSVTITDTGANTYTLDRWYAYGNNASKFSVQQDAGAVTPPAGFTDYLGVTSLAATTVNAGDQYIIGQNIEGFNVADLGWGTANAKTVTLSFWVRSSLTGTFGGALRNSADNRSYPFTYTISAANTWEQKSITIAGDTSGTWLVTNGVGIKLFLGLGVGSTYNGTAGAWSSSLFTSATGATNVVSTNGATFYITGVQLEVGTQATSFEYRQLTTELQLCQRYYQKSFPISTAPAQNIGGTGAVYSQSPAASGCAPAWVNFATVMRTTPATITTFNPSAANANWRNISASSDVNSQIYSSSQSSIYIIGNTQTVGQYQIVAIHYTADAEL